MPIALVISGVASLGVKVLERFWDSDDKDEWLQVIKQAAAGVPAAIEIVKSIANKGDDHDWSAEELRAELEKARALHDAIQATGNGSA